MISKGDEFIVFILHVYSNVLQPFQHVLKTNVECCVAGLNIINKAIQCGLLSARAYFHFIEGGVAKHFLVGCKQHHLALAGVRVKGFHTK